MVIAQPTIMVVITKVLIMNLIYLNFSKLNTNLMP